MLWKNIKTPHRYATFHRVSEEIIPVSFLILRVYAACARARERESKVVPSGLHLSYERGGVSRRGYEKPGRSSRLIPERDPSCVWNICASR